MRRLGTFSLAFSLMETSIIAVTIDWVKPHVPLFFFQLPADDSFCYSLIRIPSNPRIHFYWNLTSLKYTRYTQSRIPPLFARRTTVRVRSIDGSEADDDYLKA